MQRPDFSAIFHDSPLRCVYICFQTRFHGLSAVDVVREITRARHADLRYVYVVAPPLSRHETGYHCYRLDPPSRGSADDGDDNGLPDGVTEVGHFEGEAIRQAFLDADSETARHVGG